MKTSTLVTALCTTVAAALAAIPSSHNQQRSQQQPRLLHTLPPSPSHLSTHTHTLSIAAESVHGGAIFTPSNKTNITTATGTFIIPHARVPTAGPTANNSASLYAASFHVSIDGLSSSTPPCGAALRAGIDIIYDAAADGEQRPFAWYQLAPADAVGFANFSAAPGDTVRLTVTASAAQPGAGVATVENFGHLPAGKSSAAVLQTASVTVVGKQGIALCRRQAGWVVEDFPLPGLPDFPVALADFTAVTFGGLGVGLDSGRKVGEKEFVAGTRLVDISQEAQGGRLTKCELVRGERGVSASGVEAH
ncbi:concanavalin A-like lectin/glucanase domain-containing protein [Podospora appendiculata]|uniref:Concanavalin A-like lectin/glucanase domain-containing protein n=1 Tax=Podospora appendiculata TaxID=314037 RepID=A0AAE0X4V5_9PEZI|nr:concanavalin A-like lectin/glucanase domain-containing protein [Podospora appendiculata]